VTLADAIPDAAIRTAKHDPRMAPIVASELPYLSLSISILGPPRPIGVLGDDRIKAVEVGRHGLRIRMAGKAGLLLPSVARDRQWNSRQFLDAICSKGGLPPGSWRSDQAVLEVFDGIDYGARFCVSNENELTDPCLLSRADLNRIASWTELNLAALHSGATPLYYASDVDDREVQGIVLRVFHDPDQAPVSWLQLSIRESLPLQSTLFQMTQNAASFLAQQARTTRRSVQIVIVSSIVHHGMADDFDLAGVDCNDRALIAMDGRRWSIAFDQSSDTDDLFTEALSAQPFRIENTMIYSARCDGTESRFAISMGPQAEEEISPRPPAVAGMFYPADDGEREYLVDELLSRLPTVKPIKVEAAMVPHAGLRYSGRIAADVWRRIKMPESVLIIGPKHTADGVDWAVAPHDQWRLSADASMAGDVDLAHQIAESVPGMQLDAAAHAREHGIEVQLPLLYRIAPNVRVAAIAMAGATVEELERTSKALAELLGRLDKPPLLVISSDMNHFADDAENRRRDRIALDALQRNDPHELLQRCADENISMCGRIPAALVLLTLRAMGRRPSYREIGYATSGDVSGDFSRVVGYAGVLF
jgi:AmmeMemoRadiSam system protein B